MKLDKQIKKELILAQFLAGLQQLSHRYGLGIAGHPVLFEMETGPDTDYERQYSITPESVLIFE